MTVHIVARNETLMRIAARYGFLDYRQIYDHPNNATFKRLRPNPQVLKEGDEIFIPTAEPSKVWSCATGQTHTFVVPTPPVHELRIYARNAGQPISCERYVLEVDGKTLNGRTGKDGLVRKPVPARARNVVLRFPSLGLSWTLKVGAIDPLREPQGIRQRLVNLGYWQDSEESPETTLRTNLMQFQRAYDLSPTGDADSATIAKLKEVHDQGQES
jgi:hypothetical protein